MYYLKFAFPVPLKDCTTRTFTVVVNGKDKHVYHYPKDARYSDVYEYDNKDSLSCKIEDADLHGKLRLAGELKYNVPDKPTPPKDDELGVAARRLI